MQMSLISLRRLLSYLQYSILPFPNRSGYTMKISARSPAGLSQADLVEALAALLEGCLSVLPTAIAIIVSGQAKILQILSFILNGIGWILHLLQQKILQDGKHRKLDGHLDSGSMLPTVDPTINWI